MTRGWSWSTQNLQDMARGLDFILHSTGSHWRLLSGEEHDLICLFQDYSSSWMKMGLEGKLK